MKKKIVSKSVVLNVIEDKKTFARIDNGTQKVVFAYPSQKRAIEKWYAKWCDSDKQLVVKVWCEERKKGNKSASFICDCIWDDEHWSWFGWIPEEKFYDEFDEPADEHYVFYLGDRIE